MNSIQGGEKCDNNGMFGKVGVVGSRLQLMEDFENLSGDSDWSTMAILKVFK